MILFSIMRELESSFGFLGMTVWDERHRQPQSRSLRAVKRCKEVVVDPQFEVRKQFSDHTEPRECGWEAGEAEAMRQGEQCGDSEEGKG
jgi:hypothetical protein